VTSSHSLSVRLQLLGPVRVSRADGELAGPLLTQPRRVAILAYLAIARPHGFQARDSLIALLWPEVDQAHGRHALRNALHALRQALGDDVIVTAGDHLVGVDRARIFCDALELENDVAAGRLGRAVSGYEGELLRGFHVNGAPEFERWLDAERIRLRDLACAAGWRHADECLRAGDVTAAVRAARAAHAYAPDDELSLRRLLELLTTAGDRSSALRAYREFADRLRAEYGVEPSTETRAMLGPLPAVVGRPRGWPP
jgi:DNA-binding SARP family transcriptional activator